MRSQKRGSKTFRAAGENEKKRCIPRTIRGKIQNSKFAQFFLQNNVCFCENDVFEQCFFKKPCPCQIRAPTVPCRIHFSGRQNHSTPLRRKIFKIRDGGNYRGYALFFFLKFCFHRRYGEQHRGTGEGKIPQHLRGAPKNT